MPERLTEWAKGRPPMIGWWDTKARSCLTDKDYEIRLWWDGSNWKASPISPSSGMKQQREWRGLAEDPSRATHEAEALGDKGGQ